MSIKTIKCPFCDQGRIDAKPGKHECPRCRATFEIDDRIECAFVDLDQPWLPLRGTYCRNCGLIQSSRTRICGYCGALMNHKIQ